MAPYKFKFSVGTRLRNKNSREEFVVRKRVVDVDNGLLAYYDLGDNQLSFAPRIEEFYEKV